MAQGRERPVGVVGEEEFFGAVFEGFLNGEHFAFDRRYVPVDSLQLPAAERVGPRWRENRRGSLGHGLLAGSLACLDGFEYASPDQRHRVQRAKGNALGRAGFAVYRILEAFTHFNCAVGGEHGCHKCSDGTWNE